MGSSFDFAFDWTGFDDRADGTSAPWVRVPVSFRTADGRLFRVEVGNWGLLLPGRAVVDFDEGDVNRFVMQRRGDAFRFLHGPQLLSEVRYPALGDFVGFELEVPVASDGRAQRFTAFSVTQVAGGPAGANQGAVPPAAAQPPSQPAHRPQVAPVNGTVDPYL